MSVEDLQKVYKEMIKRMEWVINNNGEYYNKKKIIKTNFLFIRLDFREAQNFLEPLYICDIDSFEENEFYFIEFSFCGR